MALIGDEILAQLREEFRKLVRPATGYPDLARRHRVNSVPKTIVGDDVEFVGALPEAALLQHVQAAAPKGSGLVFP